MTESRARAADPYRIVLLAVGPGLVSGTASSLLLGYGTGAPALPLQAVFTYAYLLLWTLPALPLMALALARWPRPSRIRVARPLPFLLFLVSSLWHLIVLEVVSRVDTSSSFLVPYAGRIATAHLPTACCTVAAWVLYVARRERRASSPRR